MYKGNFWFFNILQYLIQCWNLDRNYVSVDIVYTLFSIRYILLLIPYYLSNAKYYLYVCETQVYLQCIHLYKIFYRMLLNKTFLNLVKTGVHVCILISCTLSILPRTLDRNNSLVSNLYAIKHRRLYLQTGQVYSSCLTRKCTYHMQTCEYSVYLSATVSLRYCQSFIIQ